MAKLEPFDNKRTKWSGLWYHPDKLCFTSATFSIAELRKFKGNIRLIVKKNRWYNNGENQRPNYVFIFTDSQSEKYLELEVVDDTAGETDDDREQGVWETVYDPYWPGVEVGYKCSVCGLRTNGKSDYCAGCGAEML